MSHFDWPMRGKNSKICTLPQKFSQNRTFVHMPLAYSPPFSGNIAQNVGPNELHNIQESRPPRA
jgi:hypothetical protein